VQLNYFVKGSKPMSTNLRPVVARYVLVDLQETCFYDVVKLIPGWWDNAKDALASMGASHEFMSAKKLNFTEEYADFVYGRDKYPEIKARYEAGKNKRKCIVKGCTNHAHEGAFVGDLCAPCHTMITTGDYGCGNTVFHHAERERQQLKETMINIQQSADIALGDV